MGGDQLLDRRVAVAGHDREVLVGDRPDPSRGLSRHANVEDTSLEWAWVIGLKQYVVRTRGEIRPQFLLRANQPDSHSSLTDVRLRDEGPCPSAHRHDAARRVERSL